MILIDINNYDIIYNNPRDLVFVTSDMIMNYYDVVYDYVEDYH
jgi:hypothetical protein